MNKTVVTRFAPSPTGQLHLGSIRTALFNWLWARKNNGQFIVRLEDTDQERLVEGAANQMMADLQWLGIDWDYGPNKPSSQFGSCIQSQRLSIYREMIQPLIESGVAYYDHSTPEQLKQLREQAQATKQPFVFRKSMAITDGDKRRATIRIAIADEAVFNWQDGVRGQQSWQGKDVADFVAIKSDGYPTYQFANVIDDHLMGINHVIRADEWLSSTPKHLHLFNQLGFEAPKYSHVAPVLSPTGNKKLSKRDGAQAITDYQKMGYLKQALMNFLCLLGWNPGTEQELFTPEELIEAFDISRLQASGARFDPVRLDWMNGQHIRRLSPQQRFKLAAKWWPRASQDYDEHYKQQVLELVFERLKKWSDLEQCTAFFFESPASLSPAEIQQATKFDLDTVNNLLQQSCDTLQKIEFSLDQLNQTLYGLSKEHKLKTNNYFMLLRLKLTGSKVAPGLMETMHTLGKEVCLSRLAA